MSHLPGRLGKLTAKHVMTGKIISVCESDTLEQAVRTFRDHHITGAPVIDDAGALTGILSVWDLIRTTQSADAPDTARVPLTPEQGPDPSLWDLVDSSPFEGRGTDALAKDRMSPHVTSVGLDASLVEVARAMCDGHWHRVPVVDQAGKLAGIVSTMDVLAALVNVADEPA